MKRVQSVKVDDLSDDQIRIMMQRAKSMGYSDQNIIQYARSEGLSAMEISKLSRRINKIRAGDNERKSSISDFQRKKERNINRLSNTVGFRRRAKRNRTRRFTHKSKLWL